MSGLGAWLARHGRAVKLGSVVLSVFLVVGGLALGMATSSSPQAQAAGGQARLATPTRHFIVGVVVERLGANTVIVRNRAGRFFVVTADASTQVRRDRQTVPAGQVRRGTRVIILGDPSSGGFHAQVVTITGTTAPEKLPSAVPQNSPRRPAPRATATPSPRPLSHS
jgi:hypothetical protein